MDELIIILDELLSEVSALEETLHAEFEAIKAQDLDQLDEIQKLKENALRSLSDGRFERTAALVQGRQTDDLPANLLEKWQQLKDVTQSSQQHLKRNELVIQRKLAVLREALQSMYQTDFPQNLQLYNRTGKLSGDSGR
jgi:flagellar biosynthesis/type III secretory pathway chaperone